MARVFTQADAKSMGLPGRKSIEIASQSMGTDNVTLRYVEIPVAQPGAGPRKPHRHDGFEEVIHVLEGNGCTEADSGSYPLAAGDTIVLPSGEWHATRNTGDTTLKLLCFFPVGDITTRTSNG
jgi:quercetin dioxygenase-like cupin family protein